MNHEKIEQILSELVMRVASFFRMNPQDALAAVATSNLANELSRDGNTGHLTIDELSERIYSEIARGE